MSFTVKQARMLAGISQQQMADFLGVCRDSYRKIEENPEKTTIEQAKKISQITGVSYDQIFFAAKST